MRCILIKKSSGYICVLLCIFIFSVFCLLTGCNRHSEKEKNTPNSEKATNIKKLNLSDGDRYISMTVTSEKVKDDFITDIYAYDIKSEELHKLLSIPYESQYPLSCVDLSRNYIYYTANDEKVGDQLYAYNMASEETYQLTDCFYAINYITPTKDGIYIVGCKSDEHNISLYYYDFTSSSIVTLSWNDDLFIGLFYYDVDAEKAYVSGYLNSEFEKYRSSKKSQDHYIYEIDSKGNYSLLHTKKNKRISNIFAKNNKIWFITQAERMQASDPVDYCFYQVQINKKQDDSIKKISVDQGVIGTLGEGTYIDDNENIYTNRQGKLCLYSGGFRMKKEKEIYTVSENQAINNIQILPKYSTNEIISLSIDESNSIESLQEKEIEDKDASKVVKTAEQYLVSMQDASMKQESIKDEKVKKKFMNFIHKAVKKKKNKKIWYHTIQNENGSFLLLSNGVFNDGSKFSTQAKLYQYKKGKIKLIDKIASSGTSYPICEKQNYLIIGGHHWSQLYFMGKKKISVCNVGYVGNEGYKISIYKIKNGKKIKLNDAKIEEKKAEELDYYYDSVAIDYMGKPIKFTVYKE